MFHIDDDELDSIEWQKGYEAGKKAALADQQDTAREDAPCALCGEMTNSFAGNGSLWPVWFCHADGTGVSRPHHQKCVSRLVFPDDSRDH